MIGDLMTNSFLSKEQQARSIDVTSIENALVDLLVRAEESDLRELGMHKGRMQLVDGGEQARILGNLGRLTAEVELGGSAANALRAMALVGAEVSYSSCVGRDSYGDSFSARLEQLSIRNRLAVVPETTGTCLVVVTPDGERTLNTHLGACRSYHRGFVPEQDIKNSKVFFTTGYVWDTPEQVEAIEHALSVAHASKVKIALDVADPFVVSRSKERFGELFRSCVSLVFANAQEAEMLVGCTAEKAALKLGEQVELAVVKDGAHGAWICHHGKTLHIPTRKVNVVDTTGAGDLFAGGFLLGLVRGKSLDVCGQLGTLLASDTVTHMGVRLTSGIELQARALLS
ncbi:MAG: adenosine kinase [Betaproteobacteria bacterium]|nr:adenosine kinase [Betaproteobacteria bacterium]